MQVVGLQFHARVTRAAIAAAGLAALLALQPEPGPLVAAAWAGEGAGAGAADGTTTSTLILSDQARRYLALQYRSYSTEFMGCMVGEIQDSSVVVRRIAPADVDPSQSAPTYVVPKQSCEQAGWAGTVGMIHSHPGGERCWYHFPGTRVLAADGVSFARQPYPVDAIMCGDRVVWIGRDMVERQLSTAEAGDRDAPATAGR